MMKKGEKKKSRSMMTDKNSAHKYWERGGNHGEEVAVGDSLTHSTDK